ncbi:MAG TPA: S-methyl-5-thioribose-1-phosphate isomerase [Rectinemataceae bacterium]|nr:S-methyl-5-thioribose-1-phosphate isomerase [Rectinemataceae bacterium]
MKDRAKVGGCDLARSLRWEGGELYLLDQTRLPGEVVENRQESVEMVRDSIKRLAVRGAPAIGIAGAYGLVLGLRGHLGLGLGDFLAQAEKTAAYLNSSRPTAVNLSWALKRMLARAAAAAAPNSAAAAAPDSAAVYRALVAEAEAIHAEDRAICRGIGESGESLVAEGCGVLTHCNAGALAASELGTATAPLYLAFAAGRRFRVYADETRPLLQGARLTSWELQRAGLDVTLICDDMAAYIMSRGLVDLCIVGCDRVAADGDFANKIGTLGVAILARHFSLPFYVACPSSTIDLGTARGSDIVIEERGAEEVTSFGARRTAPEGIKVRNPAFDVTPHELVSGFITEKGILRPPYTESLAGIFG